MSRLALLTKNLEQRWEDFGLDFSALVLAFLPHINLTQENLGQESNPESWPESRR